MQKLKLIPVLLLTCCLCGCHSAPDSGADPVTDAQPYSGTITESNYTNININNHISINNKNHLKLLCAWQDYYYILEGYIASHYMIYYVTDENQAYWALWETEETTPDNAILHMDDFTNTEALGEINFDPDHLLAEVRTQEFTYGTQLEQLDTDEPDIWFYGYQNNPDNPDETDQFLFYQTGDHISKKSVQTDEGIELVNQLYSESTFADARFQWSSFYSSL